MFVYFSRTFFLWLQPKHAKLIKCAIHIDRQKLTEWIVPKAPNYVKQLNDETIIKLWECNEMKSCEWPTKLSLKRIFTLNNFSDANFVVYFFLALMVWNFLVECILVVIAIIFWVKSHFNWLNVAAQLFDVKWLHNSLNGVWIEWR